MVIIIGLNFIRLVKKVSVSYGFRRLKMSSFCALCDKFPIFGEWVFAIGSEESEDFDW